MVEETMRRNLYDAATKGEVVRFVELVEQDPYLLDVVSFTCSRNLLHIATMWGQAGIVEELLKINPKLAWSLEYSQKLSPLHIAAAEGYVVIASKLSSIAPNTCWWRDSRGMNPIHVAAVNGHAEFLEALVPHNLSPAREKVDRGQTVLYLCVKHGQLRALQVLVYNLGELVHVEDDDGETILHLAVRSKQVEIVQYLLENSRVEELSTNNKGKTAIEISKECPEDTFNSEIAKIIRQDGKSSSAGFLRLRMMNEVVLMTSMMIAGMAFQAAISPPGGVWQDDSSPPHKAGTAIMASTHHEAHKKFVEANKAAFVSSVVTIVLCAHSLRVTHAFKVAAMRLGFSFSVAFFTISFLISVFAISEGTGWFVPAQGVFLSFYAVHLHIAYVEPKLWPAVRRLVLDHPRVAEIRNYYGYVVTELSSLFRRRRSDATTS